MSEDAPCRGLDEGIEIVAKVYLNEAGTVICDDWRLKAGCSRN